MTPLGETTARARVAARGGSDVCGVVTRGDVAGAGGRRLPAAGYVAAPCRQPNPTSDTHAITATRFRLTRFRTTPRHASERHDARLSPGPGRPEGPCRYCRLVARRRWRGYGPALSRVVLMAALTVASLGCGDRTGARTAQRRVGTAPATPGTRPPDTGGAPGGAALIDVAVATLWVAPDLARPVDEPSVTNPVDIARWVSTMSLLDKQWLVGKLATQVLYGEHVEILETRGAWTRVAVTDQPSSLDPRGYPGWLPAIQLTYHEASKSGRRAIVAKPSAVLRDRSAPDRPLLVVSYNTRLPVLSVAPPWTTVATPDGGQALVASSDVDVNVGNPASASTGPELVRAAEMFTGLGYLWAGTSGFGYDCSGFTAAVYAAHGIIIPRDANDQATAGSPVAPGQLQPGDLLFFASNGGRGFIHHVAMYVGGGRMIQSPATGTTIETVPVGRLGRFPGEYWGARRYLPSTGGVRTG